MNRDGLLKIGAALRGETRPLHWFRDHEPTEDDYCYECIRPLAFKALIELGPLYDNAEPPIDPEAMLGDWIADWLAGGEAAPWAGPRDEEAGGWSWGDPQWARFDRFEHLDEGVRERIDEPWDVYSADCQRFCESCGARLQFSPTDYCFEEEAQHFAGTFLGGSVDFGSSGSRGIQFEDLACVGHTMEFGDWGLPEHWEAGRRAYEVQLTRALTPDVCRTTVLEEAAQAAGIPRTPLAQAVEQWAAMNSTRTHRLRMHLEAIS